VCQEWVNDYHETHQTAFGLKKGCIGKLDRCLNLRIGRKLFVNETVETHVTSRLPRIKKKTPDRMSNKLLHTESAISCFICFRHEF
jgi:hypothetical protein